MLEYSIGYHTCIHPYLQVKTIHAKRMPMTSVRHPSMQKSVFAEVRDSNLHRSPWKFDFTYALPYRQGSYYHNPMKLYCSICDEIVYPENLERCDACQEPTHTGCMSDEGEDGKLCANCGVSCRGCNMIILTDSVKSEHVDSNGNCPDQ
jgi:hypothetical protein